jgi:hypothetical protein
MALEVKRDAVALDVSARDLCSQIIRVHVMIMTMSARPPSSER